MPAKAKANKAISKSMRKRTTERVLNRSSAMDTSGNIAQDDDAESIDSDSGSDMDLTTNTLESFDTYFRRTDYIKQEPSFYHIASAIYRLALVRVVHPEGSDLIRLIMSLCTTVDNSRLSQAIEEVVRTRGAREIPIQIPLYLQMAEEWVRITVRDGEQEIPEAYRALEFLYKATRDIVMEKWKVFGEKDMRNTITACQQLGLGQAEIEQLIKNLEGLKELHQENRIKVISLEIDAV